MSLSTLLDRSEVFFFPTFATTEYLLRRRFGFFGGDDGCGESSTTTCCSILFFIFSPNVAADDRKPIKKIHVYIYIHNLGVLLVIGSTRNPMRSDDDERCPGVNG